MHFLNPKVGSFLIAFLFGVTLPPFAYCDWSDEVRHEIKDLEVSANKGQVLAQLELGKTYFSGRGDAVATDYAEAFYWFDLAAKQKNAEAFYYLGIFYWNGSVVDVDERKAAAFFKLAADAGLTPAKLALGYIYATNKNTKTIPNEAFRYLSSAANDGVMDAKLAVAFMHIDGIGTAKDLLKGSRLLRQVADLANGEHDRNRSESNAAKFSLQFLNGYTRTISNDDLKDALFELKHIQDLGSNTAASAKEAAESILLNRGEKASVIVARATYKQWIPPIMSGGVMPVINNGGDANNPPTVHGEQNNQKITKTGSGVMVSNSGAVLTNYHVVSGCNAVLVDGNDAKLIDSDPNNDLALLATKLKESSASVRKGKLKLGEEVVVAGFPLQSVLNNGINITNGVVSSLSGINNDTRFIQVSAPVNPGNSGGALLDMYGDLVGLVTSTLKPISDRSPQNINFAINTYVIENFLTNNHIQASTSNRNRQEKIEGVAKMAIKFTKFISCVN